MLFLKLESSQGRRLGGGWLRSINRGVWNFLTAVLRTRCCSACLQLLIGIMPTMVHTLNIFGLKYSSAFVLSCVVNIHPMPRGNVRVEPTKLGMRHVSRNNYLARTKVRVVCILFCETRVVSFPKFKLRCKPLLAW